MPYVNVPNDLSKIKTKMAFNLTKRQLLCFGAAAVIGVPTYLVCRNLIGNSAAMLGMIALMLPCFFMAMYERDGLPFEKVARNIVRSRFIRPGTRPYKTENFYDYLNKEADYGEVEKAARGRNFRAPGKERETKKQRAANGATDHTV